MTAREGRSLSAGGISPAPSLSCTRTHSAVARLSLGSNFKVSRRNAGLLDVRAVTFQAMGVDQRLHLGYERTGQILAEQRRGRGEQRDK